MRCVPFFGQAGKGLVFSGYFFRVCFSPDMFFPGKLFRVRAGTGNPAGSGDRIADGESGGLFPGLRGSRAAG